MIRFRPALVPTLVAVPAIALMVGLGVWQLQRLEWKEALIAAVDARIKAPSASLEDVSALPVDETEYRPVRLEGRFLHDKEVYLFAIGPERQPGVHVITPLERTGGDTVLVDRGFVPEDRRSAATRQAGQVAGDIVVTGLFRGAQTAGMFTPDPDLTARLWYVRNPVQMASTIGLSNGATFMIEANSTPNPGGLPVGGQTIVDFPNSHLAYAWTWFGLALTLLAVYLLYHHHQHRLGFQ